MSIMKNGQKYYRAHEVGYPESEILEVKMFTSVGGKHFDKVEFMDEDATKKERLWYMRVFGEGITVDAIHFEPHEIDG